MSVLRITADNSPHRAEDWSGVTEALLEAEVLTDGVGQDLNYANRVAKVTVTAASPAACDIMSIYFTGAPPTSH